MRNDKLVKAVALALYREFEGRKPETPPQGHWLVAARAVLAVAEPMIRADERKAVMRMLTYGWNSDAHTGLRRKFRSLVRER